MVPTSEMEQSSLFTHSTYLYCRPVKGLKGGWEVLLAPALGGVQNSRAKKPNCSVTM